jgi:membrane dipeptidase
VVRLVAGADQYLMRIDSPGDFARVRASGKIAILPGLQNSEHFRRPSEVAVFHGLGQRISQLTYNSRNLIGNGSTERRDEGISDFGAAMIDQMNKVGMAIDTSHCGDRTTLDAFELSKKPVLITHSNCRALVPGHPRCKSDDAIAPSANRQRHGHTGGGRCGRSPRRSRTCSAFNRVRKLIGPSTCVGSDMDLDGYDDLDAAMQRQLRAQYKDTYAFREKIDIEGLDHPKRMFDLTEGLIRRGYSDAEIRGVLGGNFVRVLTDIWNVAPAR